jgi:hypothetical protein
MVCNVAVVADNWLRTPYIPRGAANRLYVDVKFSMRRCTKYPDPTRLQQCKESFKVRFHRYESVSINPIILVDNISNFCVLMRKVFWSLILKNNSFHEHLEFRRFSNALNEGPIRRLDDFGLAIAKE